MAEAVMHYAVSHFKEFNTLKLSLAQNNFRFISMEMYEIRCGKHEVEWKSNVLLDLLSCMKLNSNRLHTAFEKTTKKRQGEIKLLLRGVNEVF